MAYQLNVDEIVASYELEPTLRDVFVEGPNDAGFFSWFLNDVAKLEIKVCSIDSIEVTSEQLSQHRMENNNRGRVMALGYEIFSRMGADTLQATCVADADFDLLLGKANSCPLIFFTDYTSVELYAFDAGVLGKYLKLCCPKLGGESKNILQRLIPVLQELFLIRFANQKMCWKMEWLDFIKFCGISNDGSILFDYDCYLTRYLQKNRRSKRVAEFKQCVDQTRAELSKEPRHQIHGHDFMNLLGHYLAKRLRNNNFVRSSFSPNRSLLLCVEAETLKKEMTLQTLISRLDAAA